MSNKKTVNPIIIIGGGGHAKVLISILKKLGLYNILGYTDINDKGFLLGVKYLGDDKSLSGIIWNYPDCSAALGIGNVKIDDRRKRIKKDLENLGFTLPAIISPTAIVNEQVSIGLGSVVYDGVIINSGTKIGEGVILNTKCSIDHDCTIGDYVHIAPGVTLSGGINIGDYCLLGTGCTVIHYKTIEKKCIIGAGAAVVDDCLEEGVYIGVPARRLK